VDHNYKSVLVYFFTSLSWSSSLRSESPHGANFWFLSITRSHEAEGNHPRGAGAGLVSWHWHGYIPSHQPRLALGPSLEQPNIIPELTCPSHVRGTMSRVPRDRRVQARADSAAIRIARIRARRAGPDRLPCCGSGTGTTERQEIARVS